jgi:hypothetical protein
MMQVVAKWKVIVKFSGHDTVIWISDNHIENVLRQLAAMQFTESGLERPTAIHITGA